MLLKKNRKNYLIKVALIIVGTNEKQWLASAFNSILKSDFKKNLIIFYVDNNSSDGSVKYIKSTFPSIRIIINESNLGFSGANNEGIKAALKLKVDYIFLVNPDTQMPKGLISSLVRFMEENIDFGAVGPMQAVYGQSLEEKVPKLNDWSKQALKNGENHIFQMDFKKYFLLEISSSLEILSKPKRLEKVLEHGYIQGAALFIRANILDKVGIFDLTYHTFYEEIDLCRRIRWCGYRIGLLLDQYIQHQGGGSTEESIYKKEHMMRNKYYFLFSDPTWKIGGTSRLLAGWVWNDFKKTFPKNILIFFRSMKWVFTHLPKSLKKRHAYKKISFDRKVILINRKVR